MAGRMPKCKHCGQEVDKDTQEFIKKANGYYHKECHEEVENQSKEKPKTRKKKIAICSHCGEEIDRENDSYIQHNTKFYHEHCHKEHELQQREKNARKCVHCDEKVYIDNPNDFTKHNGRFAHISCQEKFEREKANRDKLYDYISEKYFLEIPTPIMMKQMQRFKEDNSLSYKAQLAIFKYMFDVEGVKPNAEYGLGLILYYVEKAKTYYANKKVVRDASKGIEINNKPTIIKGRINPRDEKKLGYIDLNDI